MKHLRTSLFVILLMLPATVLAQVKTGTMGVSFLKVGTSARAAAMGDAFLPLADDVSALFYNPAGLIQLEKPEAAFTHLKMFDNIGLDLEWVGYAKPFLRRGSVISVIGVSATFMHTDMMDVTTPIHSEGTGEQFNWTDLAVGLTWTQRLTNKFSVGTTVKLINESTYGENALGWAADVGTYYDTNWRTVRLAMMISNFGPDLTFVDTPHPLPIEFRFGIGATPIHTDEHNLEVSFQFGHPSDNVELAVIGLEYEWNNFLALRYGKKINGWRRYTLEDYQENIDHNPHVEYPILGEDGTLSLDGMSWGVGIKWHTFQADFGFVFNEYLGPHKFVSLQYQF
jgi:hypothetical protein